MIKKLLLSTFLLISSSYSSDFINDYRLKGIDYTESVLDMALEDSLYWSAYLKDKDVSLGYYESMRYIITVDKERKLLKLYRKDNIEFKESTRTSMNQLTEIDVLIGRYNGKKTKEGDLRTPVGNYDLVKVKRDVDPFYGPLAFVTSYPNNYDRVLNHTGSGIWLHGLPENIDRKNYTRGCVALENEQLEELGKSIDLNKTTLIISNTQIKPIPTYTVAMILSNIYKWRNSWKHSDINRYLNFYSPNFKKLNGDGIDKFSRMKKRIFARGGKKTILFSDINIMPYPNEDNKELYRVYMKEDYKAPNYKFKGTKELIIELNSDLEMKIIFED
jgi:murein L,D-transpeptidase YafK